MRKEATGPLPEALSEFIDEVPETETALVGPNEWRAMWTYDTARVARIGRYIRQNF